MIKRIQRIGISTLAAGLSLLLPPGVAHAQDSVFVTTTGDVGIGTSTPAVRLDVQANASSAATARLRNSSVYGFPGIEYVDESSVVSLFFGLDNANNTSRLHSLNNHPIVILTNGTERARVTSAGDVGIGTASPGRALHVKGRSSGDGVIVERGGLAQDTEIQFTNEINYTVWTMHFDGSSPEDLFIYPTHNSKDLVLQANETGTAFGNVGIGTSNPTSRLHVNGDIRITGGSFIDDNVTLAPDYVFEPDYELMPLDELAAFVRTEKHLPNVPKAAEIRASGLNLSQFQMRLLEKIEELTLYTLAQQEQIAALAAKVEALEAK